MSSNRKHITILLIVSILLLNGCGKKSTKEDLKLLTKKFESKEFTLKKVKEVLGKDVKFAVRGNFKSFNKLEIAAAKEINNDSTGGIQFFLLGLKDSELIIISKTDILKGSLTKSLTNKIKFPLFENEMIYYNSNDYYLGSNGGEQFSYIINFKKDETYYSHIVSVSKKIEQIFISNNIKNQLIKEFFISNARRDFPNIKVSKTDINIDEYIL